MVLLAGAIFIFRQHEETSNRKPGPRCVCIHLRAASFPSIGQPERVHCSRGVLFARATWSFAPYCRQTVSMKGKVSGCSIPESAKITGISSPVAGNADMLLVPDIESGNFVGKVLLYMTGGKGAGVILGARKPIVLTSRFDSMETKLLSIALGAVVARS